MYRPFVFVGIGALLASFAAFNSTWTSAICIAFVAVITILFIVIRKDNINKGVIIALIFIILAVRVVSVGQIIDNKSKNLIGRTADIVGQITEIDYNSSNFASLSLKITDSTEKEAVGIKIKATLTSKTDALPGDIISARVEFVLQGEEFRSYNFGNGVYYSGVIDKIYSYRQCKSSFWRIIYNVRLAICSAIDSSGRDELGAVLKALTVGDKSGISDAFNLCVRNAGVSHMLVVSGMHLGIICGVLMNLINRRTKLWASVIIGGIASVFILTVCLFHVSILRASIAYIVMLLARLIRRNSDSLSALGLGVFVAVLLKPYIFYNVAFLLSISATFAVLYPARLLINVANFENFGNIGKVFRYAYDILAISVCSIFCTLPIVVRYFGFVALAAPITNLAVTLAISVALILGVLAVTIFFLPFGRYLSLPLFFLSRAFAEFFITVVRFIGEDGFGVVRIAEDKNIYCFFITCAFILLVRILSEYLIKVRKEKNCA